VANLSNGIQIVFGRPPNAQTSSFAFYLSLITVLRRAVWKRLGGEIVVKGVELESVATRKEREFGTKSVQQTTTVDQRSDSSPASSLSSFSSEDDALQ
jgi:hypothetical protein